jgi:hypothetical protein
VPDVRLWWSSTATAAAAATATTTSTRMTAALPATATEHVAERRPPTSTLPEFSVSSVFPTPTKRVATTAKRVATTAKRVATTAKRVATAAAAAAAAAAAILLHCGHCIPRVVILAALLVVA